MSGLAWNGRGFRNLHTRACRYYTGKIPLYLFLVETLTDDARKELVERNINFDHRLVVPRQGRGGGLVLF